MITGATSVQATTDRNGLVFEAMPGADGAGLFDHGQAFTTVAHPPLPDDYVRLRASVGWPSPDLERCGQALEASAFGVTAYDEAGRAVGMGPGCG